MINVGTTTNFSINYLETNGVTLTPFKNAQRRAEKLFATCEADFAVLKSWFGVSGAFGPANRINVIVQPDTLAHNSGRQRREDHHYVRAVRRLAEPGSG